MFRAENHYNLHSSVLVRMKADGCVLSVRENLLKPYMVYMYMLLSVYKLCIYI